MSLYIYIYVLDTASECSFDFRTSKVRGPKATNYEHEICKQRGYSARARERERERERARKTCGTCRRQVVCNRSMKHSEDSCSDRPDRQAAASRADP